MGVLRALLFAVCAVIAVGFAIDNRHSVSLGFFPFEGVIEAPLFLVVVAFILLGILLGGVVVWWQGRHVRRLAGQRQRDTARLQTELRKQEAALPPTVTGQP